MRQLFLLTLIFFLFATYSFSKYNLSDITQLVVTIPQLSTKTLKQKLEFEFNSIPGVIQCEASIMTKTMLLKYNSRKLSNQIIDGIFKKWSCTPLEYTYQKLY